LTALMQGQAVSQPHVDLGFDIIRRGST
jgi:hypothetical protein